MAPYEVLWLQDEQLCASVFQRLCGGWRLCPTSQCRCWDWGLKLFRVTIRGLYQTCIYLRMLAATSRGAEYHDPDFDRNHGENHFKPRAIGSPVLSPSWYSCLHSVSLSITVTWLAVLGGLRKYRMNNKDPTLRRLKS